MHDKSIFCKSAMQICLNNGVPLASDSFEEILEIIYIFFLDGRMTGSQINEVLRGKSLLKRVGRYGKLRKYSNAEDR